MPLHLLLLVEPHEWPECGASEVCAQEALPEIQLKAGGGVEWDGLGCGDAEENGWSAWLV